MCVSGDLAFTLYIIIVYYIKNRRALNQFRPAKNPTGNGGVSGQKSPISKSGEYTGVVGVIIYFI